MNLDNAEFKQLVQSYFEHAEDALTDDFAGRTSECLSFAEIEEVAGAPNHLLRLKKADHVMTCRFCRKAIAAAEALLPDRQIAAAESQASAAHATPPEATSSLRYDSMPPTEWSLALKQHLVASLRRLAAERPENGEYVAVDRAGVLHLPVSAESGPATVKVSFTENAIRHELGVAQMRPCDTQLALDISHIAASVADMILPLDRLDIEFVG